MVSFVGRSLPNTDGVDRTDTVCRDLFLADAQLSSNTLAPTDSQGYDVERVGCVSSELIY